MPMLDRETVLSALSEPGAVRPLPGVATRLLQLPPDAGLRELCAIIECDPAVSAELLRLANSSMFGFAGQIRSMNHAVVILGFREVRNVALSLAAGRVFSGSSQFGAELWRHSVGCAVVARVLAQHFPAANRDEAFLGGILHDVGKLVFYDLVPDEYVMATQDADPHAITSIESEAFGITHVEIGQRCADEWMLPIELSTIIGGHHDFEASGPGSELLCVVRSANCLARIWGIGNEAGCSEMQVPAVDLPADILAEVRTEAESIFEPLVADFAC